MLKKDNIYEFNMNDVVVIGCSSGPDSMALLDMLLKIRKKYNLSLVVAHVNHNLREESTEEENYLREYCKINDLLFECMTIEEYGDDNFHNEARTIRYNFFEMLVNKYEANYLMTAHHGDDLAETIMMRIVRGSNLNGYSGFKECVDMGNYKIVRPLIGFTKEDLLQYNKENNIKYYVDSSNDKDKYTRNRYRKYLLPFLKEEDDDVHLKFLKYSRTLTEACKFIDKEKNKAINRVVNENKIYIDEFLKEEDYIQREILYYVISDYYQDDLILVNDKHIDLILSLIKNRRSNCFINLPNEVIASKCYNVLELRRDTEEITSYEMEFDSYVLLPNNHIIEKIDDTNDNSNNVCRLSSNDIVLPLTIRTRKLGDKMKVKGLDGSKKIKDIFIEKKVSLSKRDNWPVVVDARGTIVWIPGLKKSKFDKKKIESYDIVLKYS